MEHTTPTVPTNKAPATDLSFMSVLNEAWQLLKSNWQTLGGLAIIIVIFNAIHAQVVGVLQPVPTQPSATASLFSLVYSFFMVYIEGGLYAMVINMVRRKPVQLTDLFSGQQVFVPLLLTILLVTFGVGLGTILLVIPGLYLMVKYAFAALLAVDQKIGPMESLNRAAKLTDGHKMLLVGYFFGFVFLNILGVLAVLVGVLVTLPLTMLAQVVLYDRLLKLSGQAIDESSAPVAPVTVQGS